jgi:hypothetical protein
MLAASERATLAQGKRLEEIRAANHGQRIYLSSTKGKSITDQFRRYLTREDATHIGKALYGFLMGVCGFIAEFGLVPPDGGFRIKWAEPADLIENLRAESRYSPARRGAVATVYADGQTDVEVLETLDRLAAEHLAACELGRQHRRFRRDIDQLLRLAETHRFTVLPPDWRIGDPGEQTPDANPGTLAERITALARRNGVSVLAPERSGDEPQQRLL